MKIALLLPTRERLNNKISFMMSALSRCKSPENYNLYMGMDKDDPTLERCQKLASAISNLKIVIIPPNPENKFSLGYFWNYLADNSTEEIISMLGDDMVFSTDNWDEKILEEFKDKNCPDKFKLVTGFDGHRHDKFAAWLFIHRFYKDTTGYFMRKEFSRNWIDQWLDNMYSVFDRKVYRDDITITHNHWVFGSTKFDKVAQNLRDTEGKDKEFSDQLWPKLYDERIKEAKMWEKKLGIKADLSKIQ
ncbi:MAG: glycosyltransferase family 2 protein [Proteobacteria bacterium]|nr:glycosyltransferase family 2 protein [Pseudomonadota bacterium]NBP14786.1 glycosyltransferase family 2 protein [bacterium]